MGLKKGQRHSGQFKPNQIANPFGRPPMSPDEKEARKMIHKKLQFWVGIAQDMTEDQYKELIKNQLPLGARAILDAYYKKNYNAIKIYEDRAAGKAREHFELTGYDGGPIEIDYEKAILEKIDAFNRANNS